MAKPFISVLMAAAAFALAPTAMAEGDIAAVAVKRYFLKEVNARCHLLDAPAARALAAGYVQARNSVLRAGHDMSALSPWLAKARSAAAAAPCDAPEVTAEAELARGGFRRFLAQTSLDLPTGRTAWTGTRAHGSEARWRLVQYQNAPGIDAALGLYGAVDRYSFAVMASFKDGARPYSARLLVRDTSRVAVGLINPAAYDVSRDAPMGLSEAGALSFMARATRTTQAHLAPHVKVNSAGFSLTGKYVGDQSPVEAVRFDFPSRAFPAIGMLDPREDIVVVFECDDGPRYVRFEVGDFVTGLTWINLPSGWQI
ncbi:hypothetical protein [Asticcacaulis biprosthecium]|uniref:hypothetical protein n=1 Tax=Asticcacaulis biprosthecium TaxID=76891 RepID=UPI0002F32246|nr:hypothetical protein [Asticcacaulis biprosthecium]